MNSRKVNLLIRLFLCFLFVASFEASAAKNNERLWESIGYFVGQNSYLLYTSIGSLADGYVKGTYSKEQTLELLNSFIKSGTDSKNEMLALLKKYGKSPDDKAFFKQQARIFSELSITANDFKSYVATGDNIHAKRFWKRKKNVWSLITGK